MPTVTITLTDIPVGGVSVHTDFVPAIGAACSPAQSTALELISRTRKQWGLNTHAIHRQEADAQLTGDTPHV